MRLIDADKLKEVIHCAHSDDLEIIEKIDKQPTAFDVDKISKELKKRKRAANKKMRESDDTYSMSYYDGVLSGIAIAIAIVKEGRRDNADTQSES